MELDGEDLKLLDERGRKLVEDRGKLELRLRSISRRRRSMSRRVCSILWRISWELGVFWA